MDPELHDHSHVKVGDIVEIVYPHRYERDLFKVCDVHDKFIQTESLDDRKHRVNWEYSTSYRVMATGNITEDQLKALIHLHESSRTK